MTAATTTIPDAPASAAAPRATMRAAQVLGPRSVALGNVALPVPSAREVRVRLEGCGVCASNVPPWEGRSWFTYPLRPGQLGHEGWGMVDTVGDEVRAFAPGDRVAFLSDHAFAEYDLTAEEKLIKLPHTLAGAPFPGEPLGCAVNIFRRSGVRAGQTVAIVGVGFLGALLVGMAKSAGARVVAVTRRAFSRRLASLYGADEVVPLDDADPHDAVRRVAELTDGSGGYDVRGFCDVVIECTGKEVALDVAGEMCAVRGRLVVAGYHQDGPRQVNLQLWNWRGLDVVNAHEREPAVYLDGMRAAAEMVASGGLDPGPLYTHRLPLERLGEALDLTRDRPNGFVKALVMMR
jgi:threonine dehydrogenase-like Zn-dependent dehydrogenase